MANEPLKTSTGTASSQGDTAAVPSLPTSTATAPEPEPASSPTSTVPTSISKDSPSPVPPPPQPQPFPTPYTAHSTTWTGQSVPSSTTTSNRNKNNSIPPPPKASEMHLYRTTSTTKPPDAHLDTHSHNNTQQQYTPPHQALERTNMPNLEHPPGYRQNPAIAQPSAATLAAADGTEFIDGSHLGMRQVWDPAPGEAGGRYVYEYDFFGDGSREGGEVGQRQQAQDDEWIWDSAAGMWETTVSWMKSAGEKMAEVEEGVWRWVNGR
ncbi:hypothetical protein MaudCBS49596_004067 [Microsporum audouinii]